MVNIRYNRTLDQKDKQFCGFIKACGTLMIYQCSHSLFIWYFCRRWIYL